MGGCKHVSTPKGKPYLSRIVGSWGFMPRPASWAKFLRWQTSATELNLDPTTHLPDNFLPATWYSNLLLENRTDTMWTIWHIAFSHAFNLRTLVPHFKRPLSYVHGEQPSEHGNG